MGKDVAAEPFVDEAEVQVEAGHGGAGAVSFRREAQVPRGGPDGGDGGRGGDVVLVASTHLNTLNAWRRRRRLKAGAGQPGRGQRCSGAAGADAIGEVPVGTLVRSLETGELLADLTRHGQRAVVARGGRGGLGNWHFRSPTRRAPRHAQPGEAGATDRLQLELRLLADVGLVGFPNAGKSSLIRRLTRARPKVADYPFTTLSPQLGVVEGLDGDGFVIADVPGLIEGAAEGVGLGLGFLRHLARTRLLVHVVDAAEGAPEDVAARITTLNRELERSPMPVEAPIALIALNKADLLHAEDRPARAEAVLQAAGGPVLWISTVTGEGLDELLRRLTVALQALPRPEPAVPEAVDEAFFAPPEDDAPPKDFGDADPGPQA